MLITDRFKITDRKKTKEGYLLIDNCKLAKTGILEYRASEIGITDGDPNRIIKVYRDASELLSVDTMSSFMSKPVTLVHPDFLVDSTNIKEANAGISKDNIRGENQFMVGSLIIMDAEAVKAVEDLKIKELSLGYEADFEKSQGTTESGVVYDYEMKNIRGNHIAIVEKGRCGSDCKVADSQNKQKKENIMDKIILDGVSYEVTAQGKQLIEKLIGERDGLKLSLTDAKASSKTSVTDAISAKQAEVDDLKEKLEAEKAKVLDQEGIDKKVEARASLISTCRAIIGDVDATGKSDIELKKLVVTEKRSIDVSDKSDAYITAAFDLVCEDQGSESDQMFKDHADATSKAGDDVPEWEKKRDQRVKDNQEKWENK